MGEIIESPPAMALADASIIGERCTGAILVINTGRTRSEAARRGPERLRQTRMKVYGFVLNKLGRQRTTYYYYSSDEAPRTSKPGSFTPRIPKLGN